MRISCPQLNNQIKAITPTFPCFVLHLQHSTMTRSLLSIAVLLVASVHAQTPQTAAPGMAGSAMPIEAPTLPIGSNPDVTPIPDSQLGTSGPTSQVLTQAFGDVATFPPSQAPVEASPAGAPVQPPSMVHATTAAVGVAGMAAVLL